jgi:hypothetical protein
LTAPRDRHITISIDGKHAADPGDRGTVEGDESMDAEEYALAVKQLDAVELLSGEFAYYAAETGAWYVVSRSDVLDLGARLAAGEPGAYSLWCASSAAEEVADTNHERLDSIADVGGNPTYRCQCGEATGVRCVWTADARRAQRELVEIRWVPESGRADAQETGTYASGVYAQTLHVSPECADMLAHVYVDGEQTDALNKFVEVVG